MSCARAGKRRGPRGELREEIASGLQQSTGSLSQVVAHSLDIAASAQHTHLDAMTQRLEQLSESNQRALDTGAHWNQVQLDFSRPGKPVDNTVIEAFNCSLRRERLSQYWLASISEAQPP